MNYLGYKARRICACAVGFVFFVSGILKLMDPIGTSLIIKEYFNFLHIGFLRGFAGVIGELFAFTETFIGIFLITGIFRKATAWASTILMAGFTMLTLLLWILNPSMDCGCFGEAIHLTHAQSLVKNLILSSLLLAAFLPYNNFGEPVKRKYVSSILVGIAVIFFAGYSLMFIPMLELTPFNYSSRLEAAEARSSESSEEDDYISTFIYEKNGKKGVFTLNKLPDSTWTFVETRTVKKQDNIAETDFPRLSFTDVTKQYRDTLAASGMVFTISIPLPDKIKPKEWETISRTISYASGTGFLPLLLVASTPEDFSRQIARAKFSPDISMPLLTSVYYADYKTLISLNRSNGGAVYFNDGNLISKWAFRNLPGKKTMEKLIKKESTEVMLDADTKSRLSFQAFMLYTIALMLLV